MIKFKKVIIILTVLFMLGLWIIEVYKQTNKEYQKNENIQNKLCPCRQYKYITKGHYECICPSKNLENEY